MTWEHCHQNSLVWRKYMQNTFFCSPQIKAACCVCPVWDSVNTSLLFNWRATRITRYKHQCSRINRREMCAMREQEKLESHTCKKYYRSLTQILERSLMRLVSVLQPILASLQHEVLLRSGSAAPEVEPMLRWTVVTKWLLRLNVNSVYIFMFVTTLSSAREVWLATETLR